MLILSPDPDFVVLQTYVSDVDGTPKTNIVSGTVRVYSLMTGVEIESLAATALTQVEEANVWRYLWEPVSLAVGEYVAEYYLVDEDAKESRTSEDIIVRDDLTEEDLAADFERIFRILIRRNNF
jgi:hypothetical protein